MALTPATPEILAAIREVAGVDEIMLKDAVEKIRKWLEDQPHLPNTHSK